MLLLDLLLAFLLAAILVRPLFKAKYLQLWSSIESTFIADGRFLAAHGPHPLWQPLWYCGTRFDYIYPPVLRYGTALLTSIYIPVKAYHVFTAFMFSLGIAGIVFMVRVMGGSRPQAWFSAIACMLISPSFLFLANMRNDAPHLMPVRLGAMVRYGEGPHISSLSLLPFALAFAFLGLQRRRPGSLALAGIFCALVALTNFYGATALAMLYPILVWTLWAVHRDKAILLRALFVPALAYCLAAFWLTPAYLRITIYNLRYVSSPGNQYSVVLAIVAGVAFAAGTVRWARGKPARAYPVFVTGSLLFMTLNVLGHYAFNFRILGEPGRLIPELDMLMILFGVELLRRLWTRPFSASGGRRLARACVIGVALCAAWPAHRFIPHGWEMYPKEADYRTRVEYRVSSWMATHMPDARTYVTGSTRFWWDAWFDNAQVGGGSDQGLMNPNPSSLAWENVLGTDPDLSIRWLESLGADTVVVADKHSQDVYRDFDSPYKFVGILPVLFDDHEGNVIYKVPRRYASLARVLDRAQLYTFQPIQKDTYKAQLLAYSDFVEHGPDVPTTTRWNGTNSISVHAPVQAGQSVLVQVTYDPSWRAHSGVTELPIRPDGMDFMAIDAPPGTQDIVLTFETPLGNRVGYVVTSLSILGCFCLGFVAWKTEPLVEAGPVETIQPPAPPVNPTYPLIPGIRPLVRFVNRHLPEWPAASATTPFNPERLHRTETALGAVSTPDIKRLAGTVALVPPPQVTGRVLELGCYMQITPLLQRVCGYSEVRGAYFGPQGKIDRKTFDFPDGQFSCYVDHFDVERDQFPYPDDYFDLVVAGEIIEHMTYDPMWMLLEARRVLADGGYLLISTPNVASVTSVSWTLDGRDNPQIFSRYERPGPDTKTDVGHVREYTFHELGEAVRAAGFEIERHFTTFIDEFSEHRQLLSFLALNGYGTENRGEQTWCLARKRASLPVDRYPWFMYNP